jgi:hypothetical protein
VESLGLPVSSRLISPAVARPSRYKASMIWRSRLVNGG